MSVAVLGDARSNQHPPILAISILFYRFHNVMADKVQKAHPSWSDEDVFQQARRWVIAVIQVAIHTSSKYLAKYSPLLLPAATVRPRPRYRQQVDSMVVGQAASGQCRRGLGSRFFPGREGIDYSGESARYIRLDCNEDFVQRRDGRTALCHV